MKLSDYVAQKLSELGIQHVFMITGGGAMHLNHSLGTNPKLECVFNHHEQASAIGAEAYYRLTNRLAVVNVTTGPGGTNTLTGVHGAWTDSIGMLVISGQVKYETTVRSTGLALRQYGDQEIEIDKVVQSITKYCVMVTDPNSIRYHLEKALYLAQAGRPGPCWLDIPIDVQSAQVNPESLAGFDPGELEEPWRATDLVEASRTILEALRSAQRPVLFAGGGVRLSHRHADFLQLVEKLGIPVVTGWNAHDAIWNAHPHYVGRPGTVGDRAGNFAVQNADVLLVLGSRLNIRQVSYNWPSFARAAKKILVDVDALEMQKPSVQAEVRIHANLRDLLPVLVNQPYVGPSEAHTTWLKWCKDRQAQYPVVLPDYWVGAEVNPYCFMEHLFAQLQPGQVIVTGNGTACVTSFQAANLKPEQRLWTNSGSASMGYDLPAAIGACKGANNRPVVCLAGDGSIMMNLQELQTIAGNALPIKIFILNNAGYVSIFQTHRNFFGGVEVGAGPRSGVNFPKFERLIAAFDLPYLRCERHDQLEDAISRTMSHDGPAVCEIMIDEHLAFAPKLSSRQLPNGKMESSPLEDLSPLLPREELAINTPYVNARKA